MYNFWEHRSLKIWKVKTPKIWRDLGKFSTLNANISGTDEDVDNR